MGVPRSLLVERELDLPGLGARIGSGVWARGVWFALFGKAEFQLGHGVQRSLLVERELDLPGLGAR
ncbi:MAG TPA: hypothetical protein DEP32_04055 [Pseudomonas sp.]|nr:hypothetical protein [Pseudomonas sp.]MBB52636.1 hypothetical protein [Pseudomonadales bacterium]MBF77040.1 hypothetical protein [Pseudomonadales bacterium]HCA23321.1 hypothetical protein [Pseudomonas sp.]